MRATLLFASLLSGCYLSHGLDEAREDAGPRVDVPGVDVARFDVPRFDVSARPAVCCAAMCGTGEFCGLDICSQVTRLTCGTTTDGCVLAFQGCDEGADCPAGLVCRDDGSAAYACRPALDSCMDSDSSGLCNYACSTDAECPPASPTCQPIFAESPGECPQIGFCRVAR